MLAHTQNSPSLRLLIIASCPATQPRNGDETIRLDVVMRLCYVDHSLHSFLLPKHRSLTDVCQPPRIDRSCCFWPTCRPYSLVLPLSSSPAPLVWDRHCPRHHGRLGGYDPLSCSTRLFARLGVWVVGDGRGRVATLGLARGTRNVGCSLSFNFLARGPCLCRRKKTLATGPQLPSIRAISP